MNRALKTTLFIVAVLITIVVLFYVVVYGSLVVLFANGLKRIDYHEWQIGDFGQAAFEKEMQEDYPGYHMEFSSVVSFMGSYEIEKEIDISCDFSATLDEQDVFEMTRRTAAYLARDEIYNAMCEASQNRYFGGVVCIGVKDHKPWRRLFFYFDVDEAGENGCKSPTYMHGYDEAETLEFRWFRDKERRLIAFTSDGYTITDIQEPGSFRLGW